MEEGKRYTADIVSKMSLKEREEALRKMPTKRVSIKQLDRLNVGVYDEKGYLNGVELPYNQALEDMAIESYN